MSPDKSAGPLGGTTNNPVIDKGTLGLHASSTPAAYQAAMAKSGAITLRGPILVGRSKRDPGLNYDGSRAEDMGYADSPPQSAPIRKDRVFSLTDEKLNILMIDLLTDLSVGDMEKVALEMQKKFASGVGQKDGNYRSGLLDAEVASNSATRAYHAAFQNALEAALRKAKYDPRQITPIPMSLLDFSSFWDKATGLGITVHQVWSVKAELRDYYLDHPSGTFSGALCYTFYDDFGLDWPDVEKNGDRTLPSPFTGAGFKAWYVLQHYRKARPFITEMRYRALLSGRAK